MAMAMVTLPRFVAFQSEYFKQYLQLTIEDGKFKGFVKYSADSVLNLKQPYTKFEIEPSKTQGAANFIHIRNCYNNKYLGAINEDGVYYVGAVASEPNEDQSSSACTLFEPLQGTTSDDPRVIRIRHVGLDKYLYVSSSSEFYKCVYLNDDPGEKILNTKQLIVDWESLLILPKYISIKGDNGKYLHPISNNVSKFYNLQFSEDNALDSSAIIEVSFHSNGCLQFKCIDLGKYWDYGVDNYVHAESPDIKSSKYFIGKKIDKNTIALLTTDNKFCGRFSVDDNPPYSLNLMACNISSMISETYLTVEEPVISSIRLTNNVIFDLSNSKVSNVTLKEMDSANGSNDSESPITITLELGYTDTSSRTWNTFPSFGNGQKFPFTSGVPSIATGGEVVISDYFNDSYSWGKTIERSKKLSKYYMGIVPPMTGVKVTLMLMQAQYDVPFSYTQKNSLFSGEVVLDDWNDGMYTGVNYYNVFFQREEYPLHPYT